MKRRSFLSALGCGPVAGTLALGARPASAAAPSRKPAPIAGASGTGTRASRFPNVELATHDGRRVRFYDDLIRGDRIVLINFMYTQCADVCPGTLANLVDVQRELAEHCGRDVFFHSISLQPRHDTPAVLARQAELYGIGPGWTFLTGRPRDIERLRRGLGFADSDPEADRDLANHTGMVRIGNDALDRWIACPGMAEPAQLAREIAWLSGPRMLHA